MQKGCQSFYCQRLEILVFLFEKTCKVMIKDPRAQITQKQNWQDYYLLSLKSPQIASMAKPGQFVMVKVSLDPYPLLRRPFSIHSREKDQIEIFFEKIGVGTTLLAQKETKETLDILGPLGKGFRVNSGFKGKAVFLVGGGRGIAPLYFLAQVLAILKASATIFYGAKSLKDLCLKEKLEKYSSELLCSTEDGSFGFKGLVSELLIAKLKNFSPEHLFVCGPEAMMKKIAQMASKEKIPAQFSLEAMMGCGFGACWSCVRRIKKDNEEQWKKTCEEGPVFSNEEIIW